MNSLIKIGKSLSPILIGGAIFTSYSVFLMEISSEFLANFILEVIGRDNLILISEYLSPRGRVHFMSVLSVMPLAVVFSFLWIIIAKRIDFIKSRISVSILISLIPFLVFYSLLFYINLRNVEVGFSRSLLNYNFGYWSDTLVTVFMPYYILLLAFKLIFIKHEPER